MGESSVAPSLAAGVARGGAPRFWSRVVGDSLDAIRDAVPSGSRVLEVGYGDGELSCWMVRQFGWQLTGLEVSTANQEMAERAAAGYELTDRVSFQYCRPEDTRRHLGQYDAVFIKTVLYSSRTLAEYAEWLDWIVSVLKPNGVLVNYETGLAHPIAQRYRHWRRREYADARLYTAAEEALYDARFTMLHRRYYGGLSQFLAPLPVVYPIAAACESTLSARTADNCFAVAIVARRSS